MKAVTVTVLKKELKHKTQSELIELCLRLSKFKKENKELLTYLLFEASFEDGYIETVKLEIDEQFELVNTKTYYFIKKSIRKILRMIKKYIRYSKKKETEIELLLYFCQKLKEFKPSISRNSVLQNIFDREILSVQKKILLVHEDLQYDYNLALQQVLKK